MLKMEFWTTIAGYEGLYEISNMGQVRNRYNKYLKQSIDKDGYYRISLCKNNKHTKYSLHRLLALAFIPNPDNKPWVDHIDRNRQNNSLDNLRWISIAGNSQNCNISKNNTSGYTNIAYAKEQIEKSGYIRKAHYKVHLIINNKRYRRSCKTLEDAIIIRDKLLKELSSHRI